MYRIKALIPKNLLKKSRVFFLGFQLEDVGEIISMNSNHSFKNTSWLFIIQIMTKLIK